MKCKFVVATLAITISQAVSAQGLTDANKTNERIDQLERRLAAYERENSDGKMLGNQNRSASSPVSSTVKGVDLKLYGDAELDASIGSYTGGIFNRHQSSYIRENADWGFGGRIKVGIDADQKLVNGNYVGVSVQPLFNADGNIGLDDAFLKFGSKPQEWEVKVGRYEAYDMFPLNQDTFIDYSGNGSNELYGDGSAYSYQMKEGRGRTSTKAGGAGVLLSKTIGPWYLETNILAEDGTAFYGDEQYHGRDLYNRKNAIYVRPVIAYTNGPWSAAIAYEGNVINNAYGTYDGNGKFIDQSGRNGYGFTVSHDTLGDNGFTGAKVSFSTAFMDAKNENDLSIGLNGLYRNFELGYIYAHNDINNFDGLTRTDRDYKNDADLRRPGSYDINTVHASYRIPGLLGIDNFDAYVGAYASAIASSSLKEGESDTRLGVRGRLKYYF